MAELTADRLRELVHYEPTTGAIVWKVPRPGRKASDGLAGTLLSQGLAKGRRRICIDGRPYFSYRLAWLFMTGAWPEGAIDHKDGNPSNDAWENLRDVEHGTNLENQRSAHSNSRTRLLGVTAKGARFVSNIRVGGRLIYLGTFDTAAEAHEAYLTAKRQKHGGCTI